MVKRNVWLVWAVVVVFALSLSACAASGGITMPEREVPISIDSALEAQDLAMAGLMMGSVDWTEAQFSSLLTELMKANSGENLPVETITAWFEPDQLYLQAQVKEGVLPAAFGTTLQLAGNLDVQDGVLVVDIEEAAAGPYTVTGAALAPINAQINGALANQPIGLPLDVMLDSGKLSLSMAQ